MKNFFSKYYVKIKTFAKVHKVLSLFLSVVVLGGGYFSYKHIFPSSASQTKYVLGTVEKKTIVSSISASGQISSDNQLDIKPKVSGEVIYIGASAGEKVSAGTLIAEIDPTTAQKAVRDAEANLEGAQISLEKLQKPATALSLTQAENALSNAQDDLSKVYSDSANQIISTFLDLPNIISGLENILTGNNTGTAQWNMDYYKGIIEQYDDRAASFKDTAYNDFKSAKDTYNSSFSEYQALGNNPDKVSLEKVLNDTYSAVSLASKALKSSNAFITLYIDIYKNHYLTPISAATSAITTLTTYTNTTNSDLSNLLSDINSIKQDKQSILEKEQSLDQIKAGADSLDIQSAQLSVTKAQNSLTDAKNNLADYFVRAPFDGVLAQVNVKKFDSAGSASAAATLITNEKVAEISLNEVDAEKIKVGDKTTLTFDAIDGFTVTGKVAEVDTIGTVSQGVVSYSIKIRFDSQDDRIKQGMTVNASIITDVHPDVLSVSSSAIKNQSGVSYVQVFNPPLSSSGNSGVTSSVAPSPVQVEIGISDDQSTEITSGLNENEQVVTRVISGASTQTNTQSAPTLFGAGARTTGSGNRTFNTRLN